MAARIVAGADGQYLDANDDALELLGVTLEELRSVRVGHFSGPHAQIAETVWHRLTSTGADMPTGESTIYRTDGSEVRVRYTRIARRPDGAYELDLEPTAGPEGPPVADHPSAVLREWRAAERAVEAGDTDGAFDGAAGLRELYQHSLAVRSKEPKPR